MRRIKPIIGIFLIIMSVFGLVIWEKWGKDTLLYDDALVFRKNVTAGTVITEDLLTFKRISIEEDYIPFRERKKILGYEADGFIHKGVPVFEEYFRSPVLSASEERGDYILSIPQEWIISVPESLSKGDKLSFFFEDNLMTSAYVVSMVQGELVEVIVNRNQAERITEIMSRNGRFVLAYQ